MANFGFYCALVLLSLWTVYGLSIPNDPAFLANLPDLSSCPHWDYEHTLPDNWGDLCGPFEICKIGTHQSPIDINTNTVTSYNIGKLSFQGSAAVTGDFVNNGHTIEVGDKSDSRLGEHTVTDGPLFSDKYRLVQYHFHAPSEHTVNGRHYPLEVHFVHVNPNSGRLAVIGVFFEVGAENEWLDSFLRDGAIPEDTQDLFKVSVRPYGGIPDTSAYWHYQGSLTTPPCCEAVSWFVWQQAKTVSQEQLDLIKTVGFGEFHGHNSRPTQRLAGRTVWSVSGRGSDCDDEDDCHHGSRNSGTTINLDFGGMLG